MLILYEYHYDMTWLKLNKAKRITALRRRKKKSDNERTASLVHRFYI